MSAHWLRQTGAVLSVFATFLPFAYASNFPLGPMYMSARGSPSDVPCPPADISIGGISSGMKSNPVFVNASPIIFDDFSSPPIAFGTRMPKAKFPLNRAGCTHVSHPESRNIAAMSSEKFSDSGSCIKWKIITDAPDIFESECLRSVCCSVEIVRHANCAFNSVNSKSAFAALSFASAARTLAQLSQLGEKSQ
jgi:hypothetical protein